MAGPKNDTHPTDQTLSSEDPLPSQPHQPQLCTSQITVEERQKMIKAWNETLRYPNAAQPEIIRADQKDAYFIATLQDMLESSLRGFVGARWITARSNDLRDVGRLIYYFLTTLSASQTLGEEYCDIAQLDATTGNYPSIKRRALWIFIHVYSPKILNTLYAQIRGRFLPLEQVPTQEVDFSSNDNRNRWRFGRLKKTVSTWLSLLPNTLNLTTFHTIGSLHLAIFYLTGRYFHWSNRLTRIRYLSIQLRPLQDESGARVQPPSYEFLGLLMVVQLIVRSTVSFKNAQMRRQIEKSVKKTGKDAVATSSQNFKGKGIMKESDVMASDRPPTVDDTPIDEILFEPEDDSERLDDAHNSSSLQGVFVEGVESDPVSDESNARRCTLCLGPRIDQSSLECGHVFCWRCVVGWVREKAECPLCRQAVKITDLLPLYNF
ncbi:hypothetical protein CROQUDRAFT_661254 [Cronartium quercuum f. sp. fusiforme G11]|uniref:RING-type E3 ubiquitin transferase n=1 Tax=Cronartium quercuum f. sp. fusiforme G11 TaxID=708437 RepID=A0A9P6NG89_9BASI|nr:hypothetical protein CROQUDRAFT_661254 [Cronartium quercuum f. sp. fusiforme G11]